MLLDIISLALDLSQPEVCSRSPRSLGFGPESESLIWRTLLTPSPPFHLDFCVILLQSISLLFNLFYN